MRKRLNLFWNAFLILSMILSFSCITVSCGNDEPDEAEPPYQETPKPEEPDQPNEPDEPEEPENPETPDDKDPPEGDTSKYFTPTEKDFLGAWKAYWAKRETYKCSAGKWKLSETEVFTSDNIGYFSNWAKTIAFLDDNLNRQKLLWDDAASHLTTILSAIENRESWIMWYNIQLENGVIKGGNVYDWTWYPKANTDVSMIVLSGGKNVQHRWKITQFDGESFTSSPPFYDDFPSYKDGDMKTFYTFKYRRFTNTQ